jgi:hypothetical protein
MKYLADGRSRDLVGEPDVAREQCDAFGTKFFDATPQPTLLLHALLQIVSTGVIVPL